MVEKMKRYTFIVYYKDYGGFLEKLCDIGVLHPIRIKNDEVDSDELQHALNDFDRVNGLLSSVRQFVPKGIAVSECDDVLPEVCMSDLESLFNRREVLEHDLEAVSKDMSVLSVWGDFDPKLLKRLEVAGWHVGFYAAHDRVYDPSWEERYNAIKIDSLASINYFITITKECVVDIDADVLSLPDVSYSDLQQRFDDLSSMLKALNQEIEKRAGRDICVLERELSCVKDRIAISMTKLQTRTGADDKLMFLEGWVPISKTEIIDAELEKEGIYFQVSDPEPDENVPIVLKNNRFARLFEFITNLYDLPKYGTRDMTPFFAPFFVIFFGLCFGDLGYGTLIILTMLWLKKKGSASLKAIVPFGVYMGISSAFFGLLTGNCFGIELMKLEWPFMKPLQNMMISTDDVFILALALGVVQILFGRILNAASLWCRFGWRAALSSIGWVLVIAGCIIPIAAVSGGIISSEIADPIVLVSGCVAAVGILLFSNPKRRGIKLLLNIPGGIYSVYENATGLLGDVLSYIRLFALSLSGAVMAIVFNKLAVEMSPDIPFVRELIMIVILLVGHGMNIFMSGLGSFIHPMRLTFVEFYKNAGFEGGGKKYSPLKRDKSLS